MMRILSIALLLSCCAVAHADVYKRVDAQGNVEYTDMPRGEKDKAISLPPSTIYSPLPEVLDAQNGGQLRQAVNYESVTITQPVDDEAVRENAGNLAVVVTTTPPLSPEHQLQILIDGKKMAEGQDTSFQVNNLDRGTHTVQAQIVDATGNIVASSRRVTFHMQRTSVLQNPEPGTGSPYTMPEPYQSPSPYQMPEPYQSPSPYQMPAPYQQAPK